MYTIFTFVDISVMSVLIHGAMYGNKYVPSDFEFKKEVSF